MTYSIKFSPQSSISVSFIMMNGGSFYLFIRNRKSERTRVSLIIYLGESVHVISFINKSTIIVISPCFIVLTSYFDLFIFFVSLL
ncbi:hypothetical protein GLOIN_2v1549628 [Rhizophagus irregularis DAOM 181602=DAOM 197198]|uniref:Uncharacterized protein n=1 Tax=Rhizophagus irregularis (strain DAOM 181602 / DAOM 197198 / MUCL 43194) TaxID=747089 RepID=A0A2P4QHM5_RHIID|nr:hypothetical protein GLOIN_2v1549628 [Rhizophagus irregularis DAOM 181602=DAOM 197198]POG77137.1 hypothetical protein GLOIN_2v1549628 [Rhizophagus irregularis DAOM 181602=DAOM 197198]GET62309.1 hypothetical protein GLOIN_2v1549628 [Rhizophagus irregularis DAOM 181602=DAOM 197198]|eukprot:XP_025184003.1 hypothetical protein GLOIN_2v1549628 [Rhizophagus irregularis DAOM 181602=DAOM 197198]